MKKSLVSVICVFYNQKQFIRSTIQSVLDQRYQNVELIIIDSASTDGSKELIDQLIAAHPGIKFFPQKKKQDYSSAFNLALEHAKGEYIISLNPENMLNVNRIEKGVSGFENRDDSYGIQYSNAELIDEHGNTIGNFYKEKNMQDKKEGFIFREILMHDFIASPTLMFRKKVIDELKKQKAELTDKHLHFLLLASKKFKFFYIQKPLVKVRVSPTSAPGQQIKDSQKIYFTFYDLVKAHDLLENKQERKAWRKRIKHEVQKSLQDFEWRQALKYARLYIRR